MGQISVSGSGKVSVKPDIATISFSVQTTGKRTNEAISANTARMKELVFVVVGFDIAEKDRKTVGFGISPQYVYPTPRKGQKAKPPTISGYYCSNGLNIKVRDLDRLSDILAALTEAGADDLHFNFGIDEMSKHEDEARKLAFDDAKRKAELYCKRAGNVKLGGIVSLNENVGRQQMIGGARMAMASAAPAVESIPVSAGEEDVQANINVSFELTGIGSAKSQKGS